MCTSMVHPCIFLAPFLKGTISPWIAWIPRMEPLSVFPKEHLSVSIVNLLLIFEEKQIHM